MRDAETQMVRGEGSEPAAALLPNNVSSERETPCPLSSPVMKERLQAAKQRTEGIPVAGRTGPRTGAPRDAVDPGRSNGAIWPALGQPERLKHELSECRSRRINRQHRIVYQVLPSKIRILAFHY